MDKVEKFMLNQRPLLKEVSSALSRQRIKTRVTTEAIFLNRDDHERPMFQKLVQSCREEKLKLAKMIDLLEEIKRIDEA